MDKSKEVKNLALHALKTLADKVEHISPNDENYAVLRNIQKTAEAIMETILNDGTTEDSYFSSDFGWKAGEWPLEAQLQTGEKITRVSMNYSIGADRELESVTYHGDNKRSIEIFND